MHDHGGRWSGRFIFKKTLFLIMWEFEFLSMIAFRVQVRPVQVECVHAVVEHLWRKNDEKIIRLITKCTL